MQAYAIAAIEKDRERQNVPADWREAVKEFVERCEIGEVRSIRTYAKFKALIAAAPQPQPVQQEPVGWIDAKALEELEKQEMNWMPVWNRQNGSSPIALYTTPQVAQPLSNADGLQISRALHHHGLTLVRTAQGFGVMKLGEITAYAATKGTT